MANAMNRTVHTAMYRCSHRQRFSLLSIPFSCYERSTRKRRIASVVSFSPRQALDQRRFFGSTRLTSLSSPSSASLLPPPAIIYSDNHLVAVNKPAGWHSVPNLPKHRNVDDTDAAITISSKKCLLTHLQHRGLGGGSKKDFLVPLHRIDQPCTGILLFGKTSKAASRVTKVWKGKKLKTKSNKNNPRQQQQQDRKGHETRRGVMKDYLCVVPTSRLATLEEASISASNAKFEQGQANYSGYPISLRNSLADKTQWKRLDGLMLRQSAGQHESQRPSPRQLQRKQQQRYYNDRLRKGRSVKIIRPGDGFYDYDHAVDHALMRPVQAMWKVLPVPAIDYTLLLVRTSEGARHMVRALLAQVGECPILGDVRYWKPKRGENDDDKGPLKDKSVALHAYGVYFDRNHLQLGSLDTFEFRAPVPASWESFFGIDEECVRNLLEESNMENQKGK